MNKNKNPLTARFALVFIAAIPLATPAHAQINIPTATSDGYLLVSGSSRWTRTATQSTLNNFGPPFGNVFQGDPSTLTWGFVADGTTITNNAVNYSSGLISMLDTTFGAGPGGSDLTQRPWYNRFASSYNRWDQLSGVTFNYVAYDDGSAMPNNQGVLNTRADMRIGGFNIDGPSNQIGYASLPNGGDLVLDTSETSLFGNSSNNYLNLRQTIMHEVGHGLGMNHWESNNSNSLMEPSLNTAFDGPQHADILAVQRAYGDAYESVGGNNASTARALGNVSTFSGIGFDGDNVIVGLTDIDFVSIDDNTDVDFYSFILGDAGNLSVTLNALGLSYQIQEQGGANATTVDTSMTSDLILTLFGMDQTTVLTTANAFGVGGTETINNYYLATAGTYYLRVTSPSDEIQFYSLTTSFAAIPEPSHALLLTIGCTGFFLRRSRRTRVDEFIKDGGHFGFLS